MFGNLNYELYERIKALRAFLKIEFNYVTKNFKSSLFFFFRLKFNYILNFSSTDFLQIKEDFFKSYLRLRFFFKKHIYTINHKRIALNYFYFSMITGLSGAALATMIRLEMAYPGSPFFKGDSCKYLQVATAHGLIMVFFVVVPILFGGFANFLIPYHIGSKDVAFPRLNSIGFWIQPLGFILVAKIAFLRSPNWHYYDRSSFFLYFFRKVEYNAVFSVLWEQMLFNKTAANIPEALCYLRFKSKKKALDLEENWTSRAYFAPIFLNFINSFFFYVDNFWSLADKAASFRRRKIYFSKSSNRAAVTAGWTFITPFSSNIKYSGYGAQDVLLASVVLAGISTTISFTNLLITRRTLIAPGLRNRRVLIPFITISLLLTLRMLAIVTPILGAAVLMSLMDRHWQTSFFDFAYGGDPILFQHLFWFFGHPEVYILIIPSFGFANIILPFYNTRRMASKHHMIWAVYVMAYMGYVVWGHHMYLVGLDHRSRNIYSTITIMISLPATIKTVNWTLTLVNGALQVDLVFLFFCSYVFFFLVGGFTGMWLSHVGLNISMHDTFYVVAHFHLMLAGAAMMGSFAGLYYYYDAFFNLQYSKIFGFLHLVYYTAGIWITFLPMFFLGFSGLPRRIHDFPSVFLGWQGLATCGHFLTMIGVFFFFFGIFDSNAEKTYPILSHFGIPKWSKRINYYVFKIRYNLYYNELSKELPDYETRISFIENRFNEYEFFRLEPDRA
uniref:cytochrome c oxidase subunit 1 n=1 Tax=Paramecium gigas TaxID=2709424 RepID=UPI001D02B4FC|nr:cytochrome c oxidase subunit 1 [Paramecium gigas]QVG61501.1 cytochrome c oxidase subunit 1 [Paramecium gigas]